MIASRSNSSRPNLVLVNIGNTRVSIATWTGGPRSPARHAVADSTPPIVEMLRSAWDELPSSVLRAVVIGSVCPPVLSRLRAACEEHQIDPLLVVGEELPQPIDAEVAEPRKVGTDRLCAAAAAFAHFKQACVVADFGTALTVDLVADNGVFLGGTILPGLALSARALHEHTALLPLVDMATAPAETLGKDTQSAIRGGIYAMMIGALREITERYATQLGKWPPLVLTGGDAQIVASQCDFVDRVLPDLCLDGLLIAYQRHRNDDDE